MSASFSLWQQWVAGYGKHSQVYVQPLFVSKQQQFGEKKGEGGTAQDAVEPCSPCGPLHRNPSCFGLPTGGL